MQLTKSEKIDYKKVENVLAEESKFISNFLSSVFLPQRIDEDQPNDNEETTKTNVHKKFKPTTRATSLTELQERLHSITSNTTKRKLTYKEKLEKKGIKNRMKKKTKQINKNKQHNLNQDEVKSDDVKTAKPVYDGDGKMVFSKFDFSQLGNKTNDKKSKKDPKILLKNLEKQKQIFNKLEDKGDIGKILKIKEKNAWKNAIAKAEGEKVKDDPVLLKKTVQKHEQKKRISKKKWDTRQEGVKKAMEQKQKRRDDNIAKRKKVKKTNKIKKAVKKGRIIPGY